MIIYFENLIIDFHVLNMHVKFRVNQMLFIIWSINLFFVHNFYYKDLKFKHLIDYIAIDFLFFRNFVSIKFIRKKCNPKVDLSNIGNNYFFFLFFRKMVMTKYVAKLY